MLLDITLQKQKFSVILLYEIISTDILLPVGQHMILQFQSYPQNNQLKPVLTE